jgi:hypothetical protein
LPLVQLGITVDGLLPQMFDSPALIILDLNAESFKVIQVIGKLKANPKLKDIAVEGSERVSSYSTQCKRRR